MVKVEKLVDARRSIAIGSGVVSWGAFYEKKKVKFTNRIANFG